MAPTPDASVPGILRKFQSKVENFSSLLYHFIVPAVVSPTMSLTAAISTMTYKEVTIGTSASAVKVSLVETPTNGNNLDSTTAVTAQTVALRSNLKALQVHDQSFATGELMSPLRQSGGFSTSVTEREGQDSANNVVAALLNPDVSTIRATAFLTPELHEVLADEEVPDRFSSGRKQLRYVRAISTLDPGFIDSRITCGPITATFVLGLPQNARALDPAVQELGTLMNAFTSIHKSIQSVVTPTSRRRNAPLIDDSTMPNFTFTGNINFFESKDALENNVAIPENLELYSTTSIKEGLSLTPSICFLKAHRRCSFAVCSYIIWHDTVGFDISTNTIVFGIQEAMMGVKMIHFVGNKKHVRSPSECYQIFLKIMVLLPSSPNLVAEWGFKIHQLYLQALSPEVRSGLNAPGSPTSYVLPRDEDVATFPQQTRELRKLRNIAQAEYDKSERLKVQMANTVRSETGQQGRTTDNNVGHAHTTTTISTPGASELNNSSNIQQAVASTLRSMFPASDHAPTTTAISTPESPEANNSSNIQQAVASTLLSMFGSPNQNTRQNSAPTFVSPAEQTMQQYGRQHPASDNANSQNAGRLNASGSGNGNPFCRETGCQSVYPFGFDGCFGCGASHKFSTCPQQFDPVVLAKFRREYKIHKPNGSAAYQYQNQQRREHPGGPNTATQGPSQMPRQY
jgi:hypothetical protein